MYFISPFTPLFFNPSKDKFGADSKYLQVFAQTDQILIEVISRSDTTAIAATLNDVVNGTSTAITLSTWSLNTSDTLRYATLTNLAVGVYNVTINDVTCENFAITDDAAELAKTTLIQYSMKDNKQRLDGLFWIADAQKFFDWRAPGGFMDDNWSFGVENEQFSTFNDEINDVFSIESIQKQFTLGTQIGCPIWYGAMLNRIMSCSFVYFDGDRYVRKESSVPEMTQEIEGRKSYVFKITLQESDYVDETESLNQIAIRRVDDNTLRTNRILLS